MANTVRLSVRGLVEFIYQSGDIDNRYMSRDRMLEGGRIHRRIQSTKDDSYLSEVALSREIEHEGIRFLLEGRADGIFTDGERTVIDEIKSTAHTKESLHREENPAHWAQGCCYGYIYAAEHGLDQIDIQLTYYLTETEETVIFRREYTFTQLEAFMTETLNRYRKWANFTLEWSEIRNESIAQLQFPFASYRKGQRELAVIVYRTLKEGRKLFCQAPTGIGKTISTLFPAVKALGEGITEKIFYLTAKTITRQVAESAVEDMAEKGLRLKSVTLTAKDKVCFCEERICNPEHCTYAKGHFDRINEAVYDIVTHHDRMDRALIEEYARKHHVCPFEYSLDLSSVADCIICDYNYAFDPQVCLQRFFYEGGGEYAFLVDEAHNLVDRAREMFSAQLNKADFLACKKTLEKSEKKLIKALNQVNKAFLEMRNELGEAPYRLTNEPDELYFILLRFIDQADRYLKQHAKEVNETLLQLYFDAVSFMKIADLYDERYVTLVKREGRDVSVRLYCIDPSCLLAQAFRRGRGAVLFSATLTPNDYFKSVLGGNEEDYSMSLPSPFPQENLSLTVADYISTKYKDRENSYEEIAKLLYNMVSNKVGNYMVYFPSYQYLNQVLERFADTYPEVRTIVQNSMMQEDEREEFLNQFIPQPAESLLGFAVLGGIFGEGIDLKGDRLSGCAVVSVGLPQINVEQDIIRNYYDEVNGQGFEYAYMYPGMNKVMQAAGRVIRSETDRGMVLLIDQRFVTYRYLKLFPRHWRHYVRIRSAREFR